MPRMAARDFFYLIRSGLFSLSFSLGELVLLLGGFAGITMIS